VSEALVVDVRDPPLGAAERVVAIAAAEAVLRGLGRHALAHPRARLWVEGPDDAVSALLETAARLEAAVAHRPPSSAGLRLRPTALAETSWRERGAARHALAVCGAVAAPQVFLVEDHTVGELVGRTQPTARGWVALWGGAQGSVIDREARVADLIDDVAPRLLLVLPQGHALIRRARLPLSAWLRRAHSACAGCAICAPACPRSIPVPEILRALTLGRASPRLIHAIDCTACGACDLMCPQAISPGRLVADVGRRLRASELSAPARRPRRERRLEDATALSRLGLSRYATQPPLSLTIA
jgi:ferredoxin